MNSKPRVSEVKSSFPRLKRRGLIEALTTIF